MRYPVLILAILVVACAGDPPTDSGTPPPPPPPPPPIGTVPDQTIGSGGGTITVSLPSSPIDGMAIVIPSGAFPGSQTIGISYGSNEGFPHPSGSTLLSPLITIHTTNGAIAAHAMLITIPVTVATGIVPVVVLRDPATGRSEVLPTVDYTSTSVTAIAGHFDGSKLIRGAAGSLKGAARLDDDRRGTMAVVGMPEELLAREHDSGFRPGVDSWEFSNNATLAVDDPSSGIAATEAWYYVEKKAANGNLWNKYQDANGVEESNRRGIRWTSLIDDESYNAVVSRIKEVVDELKDAGQISLLAIRSVYSIQAALANQPNEPQLAVLTSADLNLTMTVLVYKSTFRILYAVDPSNPGQTLTLDFSSGHLAPVTEPWAHVPFTKLLAPGLSVLSDINAMDDDWDAVQAGTIGNDEFPEYRMMVSWGNAVGQSTPLTGTVYAFSLDDDPPTIYGECVSCLGDARPAPFAAGTADVVSLDVWSHAGSTWTEFGTGPTIKPVFANPGSGTFGAIVLSRRPGDPEHWWNDWFPITVKRLAASIAPASPTGAATDDIDLTLSITGAPDNLEYVWDFADGPLVTTTTLATSHKWSSVGTFPTKVTARDKTTKQPVAKASVTVVVTNPLLAWKFTSASVAFTSTQPQLDGYDIRWKVDSEIIGRIALGITQGGFRIVDQAFTPTGSPPRTAPVGLYLLEGTSLTLAHLLEPVSENTFSVSTFPGAVLQIPAAPQVSAWNIVAQGAAPNPFCNVNEDSYAFNGTIASGRLTALRVPLCIQSQQVELNGNRLMSMDVDVTFGATAANGTINVTYYFYPDGLVSRLFTRSARLSFSATRLTQ